MVKYFVMDVDGTLTDGKIYIGDKGEVFKVFHVKDGYGIRDILPQNGIIPVIITGRRSKIVENRCKELGIRELYQGVGDKLECLDYVLNKYGINGYGDTAYIGDDIVDISCMEKIKQHGGIIGCPADAVSSVQEISDYISKRNGGDGAVRDFIEYLINLEAAKRD